MNLSKIVKIRYVNAETREVEGADEVELEKAVRDPYDYNLVDLGFHLLNCVREDLGLPVLIDTTLPEEFRNKE